MAIIELNYPFNKDWRKGYLRQGKDGRRIVDLFNSKKDRTTLSLARYLMSVKLGEYLSTNEEVDHINGNPFDDRVENLQVLNKQEHLSKTLEERPSQVMIHFECAYCGTVFERRKGNEPEKKGYKNTFCSRQCNGKYNTMK